MSDKIKEIMLRVVGVCLLFLLFHYQTLVAIRYEKQAVQAYATEQYEEQRRLYDMIGPMFIPRFGRGTAYFQEGHYQSAKEQREELLSECDGDACFPVRYNLGNVQVELGSGTQDLEQKKQLWTTGIEYYDQALALRPDDTWTLHNKAMLERLLEELTNEQQGQDQPNLQNEQGENQQQGQQGQQNGEEQGENEQPGAQQGDDQGSEKGAQQQEGGEQRTALSDQERAELEAYQEQLQQQQRQAQQYFNKQPQQGQQVRSMMDIIFGPPQFDQGINQHSNERDW